METEQREVTEVGKDKEKENKGQYEKTLTLGVEIQGQDGVTLMEMLAAVKKACGVVIGCRVREGGKYEGR